MKTEKQIKDKIVEIELAYAHVLRGELSNIQVNAPRALMQLEAETKLKVLHWVLATEYKSKLT